MMSTTRLFSSISLLLPLLLAGCGGLGSPKPNVQYTPTGPTEDGVPAPTTLYIYNNEYHCKYTVKIGDAKPVELGFEEYLFAEVWPGVTPASYLRSKGHMLTSCDKYTGGWQNGNIILPAHTGLSRPFLHASLGEVTDHTHPRFRAIVNNSFKLVAALTIAETTPAQQFRRNFPYYGPWPRQGYPVTGRVYLPTGVFTGTVNGNDLVQGELRYRNGDIYMGEFKGLALSGKGTLVSANGDVFTGRFSDSRPNGEGVCTRSGGSPEYCFRQKGLPVPPPALDQVAKENLERIDKQEREQLTRQAQEDLKNSETRISNLQSERQTAPQRVRSERTTMIKRCECFVADAPWFKGCLFLTDKDSTWQEREAEKRARDRTDRACEDWWDRTGGLTEDAIIQQELDRIARDLNAETAALARKKKQAEAERAALLRKQEAEREQRLAKQRALAKQHREEMLRERERECREQIAKQPFSCGCNIFRPNAAPPKPRSGGTACPA